MPEALSLVYLAVGLLMGPTVLDAFSFNPLKESALLEVLTEVAVLISLFSAGVKMPVPFSFRQWRAPMLLARLGGWLRREPHRHELLDDFLGLGLIGIVYGLSEWLQAWGFLAVFFAAVALRQIEIELAARRAANNASFTGLPNSGGFVSTTGPAGSAGSAMPAGPVDPAPPSVSQGALVFKEHLERLFELLLVLLLGGALYIDSWSWPAVGLAGP